jgi:Spherulation-specific family 4/Divergent InlB B-repeat domain
MNHIRSCVLALGSVLALTSPVLSQSQSITVPAFFPLNLTSTIPNTGASYEWIRLRNAGALAKIVVIGLDSIGTGVGSDCNSDLPHMINCLHDNRQWVLGYVNTSFIDPNTNQFHLRDETCPSSNQFCNTIGGADQPIPPSDPTQQDNVNYWYQHYAIDGIFFDNGPISGSGQTYATYYTQLYSAVTSAHSGPCSGHACIMLNASQFEANWVLTAADYVLAYERVLHGAYNNDGCGNPDHFQDYFGVCTTNPASCTPSGWTYSNGFCPGFSNTAVSSGCIFQSPADWYKGSAAKLAHVVRQPNWDNLAPALTDVDLGNIVSFGRSNYGPPGFLYVHDQGCLANGAQYTHLSSYFEKLVALLGYSLSVTVNGAGNVTSSPEGISCSNSGGTCRNNLPIGSTVTVTATPISPYNFSGFAVTTSGATSNCSSPCTFTLSGPTSITATFTPSDTGIMTEGSKSIYNFHSDYWTTYLGYDSPTIGSYTPTALSGGRTLLGFYDIGACSGGPTCATYNSVVTVGGFSSDPGSGWLASVSANGVTKLGSTAFSYSYSSGSATWSWSGTFGFTGSGTITTTESHR